MKKDFPTPSPHYTQEIKNNQGTKDDKGKPDYLTMFELLDLPFLVECSEVMEQGRKKYTFENWKKNLDKKRILKALLRHTIKYIKGEKIDKESGKSHTAHIMANSMFLFWNDNK